MIRQRFYHKPTDWRFYVYYVVTKPHADEILECLAEIGCDEDNLAKAHGNLTSGKCDTGLTYTNQSTHETVVVIAKTSTALEFFLSITHEFGHAANHIAQYYGLPLGGEDVRYICDGLLEKTWEISHELLCDCCRKRY